MDNRELDTILDAWATSHALPRERAEAIRRHACTSGQTTLPDNWHERFNQSLMLCMRLAATVTWPEVPWKFTEFTRTGYLNG